MKKFKIANNPFWKILKQTNKKSLNRSSLKIIKKIYISIHLQKQLYEHTHASSTRKETKKKKKGKTRGIYRTKRNAKEEKSQRELQTGRKQDQPSGSPRRVNCSSPRWINIKLLFIVIIAQLPSWRASSGTGAELKFMRTDPSRWPGLPLQRRGRDCNFEGNLTWTAAASVSYGQMFTVEIVYSLFLEPLSWAGERRRRTKEIRCLWSSIPDVRIFIFYSVDDSVCRTSCHSREDVWSVGAWEGRRGVNADISALWSWGWRGFRNMLINILIRWTPPLVERQGLLRGRPWGGDD